MSTDAISSNSNPWMAIGMSALAGSATILGGLGVLYVRTFKPLPFAFCLGLSSGVMVYVSLVELLPESVDHFVAAYIDNPVSNYRANAYTAGVCCMFGGWLFASLMGCILDATLDWFDLTGATNFNEDGVLIRKFPRSESQEPESTDRSGEILENNKSSYGVRMRWLMAKMLEVPEADQALVTAAEDRFQNNQSNYLRIGIFTAVVLGLHNIPEGMGTFASYLANPRFGYEMALAIGIHNIPEGISVAIPVYFGTGSKRNALLLCAISALAEPAGGFIAWGILRGGEDRRLFGILLGGVVGVMLNVAISELLVEAIRIDPSNRVTILAFFLGLVVMAASVVMFQYV